MNYRPEIDGLRAIAVLAVIFFHAGISFLPGGYLGVDIFFVISGYLITSILFSEITSKKFTFLGFYERRIRRIAPALFFVMLFSSIFFALILSPVDLKNYYQSVLAAVLFVPNILFWKQSGYFDTSSDLKPLLHTWSLGVEEQFYMLFPIIAIFLFRPILSRWLILSLLFVVALFSYVFGLKTAAIDFNAVFYLPHYRAWELLFGSIVAVIHQRQSHLELSLRLKSALAGMGLLLIAIGYLFLEGKSENSVGFALIPVIGSSLILMFGSQTNVAAILSIAPLRMIGLISFSAYLWHQPILVTLRYLQIDLNDALILCLSLALIVLLSYFSWRWVEQPFRKRSILGQRKAIIAVFLIVTVIFAVFALFVVRSDGLAAYKFSKPQQAVAKTALGSPYRDKCHTSGSDYLKPSNACVYGSGDTKVAVFGDSHVVDLAYALSLKENISVTHLSFSGCPPMLGRTELLKSNACARWTAEAIQFLLKKNELETVVVTYRLPSALYGVNHLGSYPELPDTIGEGERTDRWNSLVSLIKVLTSEGKKVVLQLPPPELPYKINQLIAGAKDPNNIQGVSLDWWKKRSAFYMERLAEIPKGVKILDPQSIFCGIESCVAVIGGQALYWDDNHLSQSGADLLVKSLLPELTEK